MGRLIGVGGVHRGVGISTTTVNLAVLLSRAERRTLLIDPHAKHPAAGRLADISDPPPCWTWDAGIPARDRPGLALAPLPEGCPGESVGELFRSQGDRWDFGLCDLPILNRDASSYLAILDTLIMVVSAESPGLIDLAAFFGVVTEVMASKNPDLRILGVLLTFSDRQLLRFERSLVEVSRSFPVDVFDFCVPREKALQSLGSQRSCVVDEVPTCRAARGYVELAMEVLDHG